MSLPLVSIIMPFFNMQTYLKESIESVLAQDYSHYELILVDDGSLDGSKQIAQDYASRFHFIKLLSLSKNHGSFDARKQGLSLATGDYVLFVDADDLIKPHTLSLLVSHIGEADMLLFTMWIESRRLYFPDFSTEPAQMILSKQAGKCDAQSLMMAYIHRAMKPNWSTAGSFYRKTICQQAYQTLEKTGLIPTHYIYSEDAAFFVAMMKSAQSIQLYDECLYFYRYVPKTVSYAYAAYCLRQVQSTIHMIQALGNQTQDAIYQAFCAEMIGYLQASSKRFFHLTRHPNPIIRHLQKQYLWLKRLNLSIYMRWQDWKGIANR